MKSSVTENLKAETSPVSNGPKTAAKPKPELKKVGRPANVKDAKPAQGKDHKPGVVKDKPSGVLAAGKPGAGGVKPDLARRVSTRGKKPG